MSSIFILVISCGKQFEFESELLEAGTADAPSTMTWADAFCVANFSHSSKSEAMFRTMQCITECPSS